MQSIEVRSAELLDAAAETGTLAFRVPHDAVTPGCCDPKRLILCWRIGRADVEAVGREITSRRDEFPGAGIAVEGDSADAAWIAIKHADCLFRRADRLDQTYADALPVLHLGREVGLTAHLIARRTREEAVEAAGDLFEADGVLTGSYQGIAEAVMAYRRKGITQFLLRGRAGHDDLTPLAEGVLPRVREWEEGRSAVA